MITKSISKSKDTQERNPIRQRYRERQHTKERQLPQAEAGKVLGIKQPHASSPMRVATRRRSGDPPNNGLQARMQAHSQWGEALESS
jgi:predicted XRE-type DNA-binding protein